MPTTIAPDRLDAYRRATFTIQASPEVTLTLGATADGFPALMAAQDARSMTIITASNPGGVRVSEERNASACTRLRNTIQRLGLKHLPATGGAAGWGLEHGFALFDVNAQVAEQLGRDFDQDAIARAELAGGVLELVTLR